MYNHARTLLLNLDGRLGFQAGTPGEELVPAEFAPLNLPFPIQQLRNILFGTAPDRVGLNFFGRRYLPLLHLPGLLGYTLALDRRITYDLQDADFFPPAVFAPVIQRLGTNTTDVLRIEGSSLTADTTGWLRHAWTVDATGGSVVISLAGPPSTQITVPFSSMLLSGDGVILPSSQLLCTLSGTSIWLVSAIAIPQTQNLADIETAIRALPSNVLQTLLTDAEPFASFRNMWQLGRDTPRRMGALLLALVYYCEGLRNG